MKKNKLKDPYAAREAAKYENPIPSRELISEMLAASAGPLEYKALAKLLNIDSDEKKEAFRRRIRAMERDGQLISNRKGEYGLTDKMDLVRGRVQGHRDGFGFVLPSDGSADVYLTHRQMKKVFDGDEVLVRPGRINYKGKQEGTIVEVLVRNTKQLVGRLVCQDGNSFVRPENVRNSHDIFVSPKQLSNASAGQFVVVEITQQPDRNRNPFGKVVEVLGDHMAPGMEIDVAIRSYGIPNDWPLSVNAYCETIPVDVSETDKKHRADLRSLPFVTIDGEDARDFDDAVYCEKKRRGGWRLYVAIADVSHYVKKDSELDKEAIVRGNSVYFPDFVVPMLPEALSNGLCSLNPNVDRLCMVCEMTISAVGAISGYVFYEAVMHSHARLTYTQVGKILDPKNKSGVAERKNLGPLVKHLDQLYMMYQALREKREERGAIDFSTNETRILFDNERKIKKIVPVQRNDAHKLIEECMLAANVCTAKFLDSLEIPALYRVHEGPSAEKLEMLFQFLGEIGLSFKGKDEITPQDYSDIISSISDRPDAHVIQTVMLRSMTQARYQAENLGHFGLAYKAYTHFTSPIRRYPDLVVHRAIRAVIRSDVETKKVKRHHEGQLQNLTDHFPHTVADMVNYGEHCSTTERRADDATRDVISWLKCEYLRERVGQDFDGIVSAVTAFGLFVELNELYVEGLIHITSLPHDYYHHEVAQHRLVGERTRRVFRLGDELRVKVARVDLDERKVDFDLVVVRSSRGKKIKKQNLEVVEGKRRVRKRPAKKDSEAHVSAKSDAKASKTTSSKKTKGKTTVVKKVPKAKAKATPVKKKKNKSKNKKKR